MTLSESELQELANRLDAELPTVQEAVNRVMQSVQAIGKGQEYDDKRGTKYSFRGVDDVVNAVGPALREHKVIIRPWHCELIASERYDTKGGARMHAVVVNVRYRITGPRSDEDWAESLGQSADMGDKAIPKAMSVAYRTMLTQLLSIPTGEPDPDSQVHEAAASNGQAQPASHASTWGAVNTQIGEWRDALHWTNEQVFDAYAKWNKGAVLAESTIADRQRFVGELAAHHMNEHKRNERQAETAEHDAMTETQTAAPASDEPPF